MEDIIVIKDKSGNEVKAEFKIMSEEYIDEIMELQGEIYFSLEDKSYFAKTSREEFEDFIKKSGAVIGVFIMNRLIAFGAYWRPGKSMHNLGYDLGFDENRLMNTAHMETVAVHKDYRGNRLQNLICKRLERIAENNGCSILCATVAPDNKYSLNTLISLGYSIAVEKEKYGGLKRYIVIKE